MKHFLITLFAVSLTQLSEAQTQKYSTFMYSGLACLESWLSLLRTLFSSAIVLPMVLNGMNFFRENV